MFGINITIFMSIREFFDTVHNNLKAVKTTPKAQVDTYIIKHVIIIMAYFYFHRLIPVVFVYLAGV